MAIQRINLGTAPSGTGGDTNRSAFKKIDDNFAGSANAASRLVGTAAGNVMEVGAFGIGTSNYFSPPDPAQQLNSAEIKQTQFIGFNNSPFADYGGGLMWARGAKTHMVIGGNFNPTLYHVVVHDNNAAENNRTVSHYLIRTDQNTSVDGNGFIKAASPVVRLFADKIECNDEAAQQDITFEKLGVGNYLVKGSLGFAQEGWYIEMPKDANGNVLVAVVYEQLENNDISVKTYAKRFDPDTGDIVANTAKPRDIPATRWIDLRLQALPQPDIEPFATEETTVATNAE